MSYPPYRAWSVAASRRPGSLRTTPKCVRGPPTMNCGFAPALSSPIDGYWEQPRVLCRPSDQRCGWVQFSSNIRRSKYRRVVCACTTGTKTATYCTTLHCWIWAQQCDSVQQFGQYFWPPMSRRHVTSTMWADSAMATGPWINWIACCSHVSNAFRPTTVRSISPARRRSCVLGATTRRNSVPASWTPAQRWYICGRINSTCRLAFLRSWKVMRVWMVIRWDILMSVCSCRGFDL